MDIDFPKNREEANLGNGPLVLGDQWSPNTDVLEGSANRLVYTVVDFNNLREAVWQGNLSRRTGDPDLQAVLNEGNLANNSGTDVGQFDLTDGVNVRTRVAPGQISLTDERLAGSPTLLFNSPVSGSSNETRLRTQPNDRFYLETNNIEGIYVSDRVVDDSGNAVTREWRLEPKDESLESLGDLLINVALVENHSLYQETYDFFHNNGAVGLENPNVGYVWTPEQLNDDNTPQIELDTRRFEMAFSIARYIIIQDNDNNNDPNEVFTGLLVPAIYVPPQRGGYTIRDFRTGCAATKAQISIFGAQSAGSVINLGIKNSNPGPNDGIWIVQHPLNMSSLRINFRTPRSRILFRRPNLMGNSLDAGQRQDDMDSTIRYCVFGSYAAEKVEVGLPDDQDETGGDWSEYDASRVISIDYRGRNLIFDNNRFVTGKYGTALFLTYYGHSAENSAQDENGWKRIHITNNNFHNWKLGAVKCGVNGCDVNGMPFTDTNGGPGPSEPGTIDIRGAIVSNNTIETSGGLFRTHRAIRTGTAPTASLLGTKPFACVFNNNTCVNKAGPPGFAALYFCSGLAGCSIIGNAFSGAQATNAQAETNILRALYIAVDSNWSPGGPEQPGRGNAIVGNSFYNARPIKIGCVNSVISNNVLRAGESGDKLTYGIDFENAAGPNDIRGLNTNVVLA